MILPYAFHAGKIVLSDSISLSVNNLSLHRGYGIFDYFAYHYKSNIHLEWYIDRFYNSANIAKLNLNLDPSRLLDAINAVYDRNNMVHSNIKLILFASDSLDGYSYDGQSELIILSYEHKDNPNHYYQEGVNLITYEHVRPFAELKSINYMIPYLLPHKLSEHEAKDVLYVSNHMVSETSRANIFCINNGQIYTPDKHVLSGITRRAILSKYDRHPVIEKSLTITELLAADEVFITSSTKKAMPVVKIDQHIINGGQVGPIAKQIHSWLINLYA